MGNLTNLALTIWANLSASFMSSTGNSNAPVQSNQTAITGNSGTSNTKTAKMNKQLASSSAKR